MECFFCLKDGMIDKHENRISNAKAQSNRGRGGGLCMFFFYGGLLFVIIHGWVSLFSLAGWGYHNLLGFLWHIILVFFFLIFGRGGELCDVADKARSNEQAFETTSCDCDMNLVFWN